MLSDQANTSAGLSDWWFALQAAEQAAWVQAVGSVVAILIAIAIPLIGSLWNKRSNRKERLEQSKNSVLRIYPLLLQLHSSLIAFGEKHDPENTDDNPFVNTDPHKGNFQKPIPQLIASITVLNDLGPLAKPLRDLTFNLIQMDSYLQAIPAIAESASPGYWINNIDDIRHQVSELEKLAAIAIEAIDNTLEIRRV